MTTRTTITIEQAENGWRLCAQERHQERRFSMESNWVFSDFADLRKAIASGGKVSRWTARAETSLEKAESKFLESINA